MLRRARLDGRAALGGAPRAAPARGRQARLRGRDRPEGQRRGCLRDRAPARGARGGGALAGGASCPRGGSAATPADAASGALVGGAKERLNALECKTVA